MPQLLDPPLPPDLAAEDDVLFECVYSMCVHVW